jgi:hypothetical protein
MARVSHQNRFRVKFALPPKERQTSRLLDLWTCALENRCKLQRYAVLNP